MIKVAIDSGPLKSGDAVRGIGVYTRELLKALNKDGVDLSKENLGKYDIVHFTRFNPFAVSIPLGKPEKTKFVLTIYDLIPLIYPKHYPPGIKGKIKFIINKYLIAKNIDAIITISETSKKDICRFLKVDPKKVHVTYLAPREIFKKMNNASYPDLPKKFALYVGDVNYNKNIPNLVKACDVAKIPLVIAGKQAKEVAEGKCDLSHPELVHLQGIDWKKITTLGFVDDTDLVKIYNLASVFIQPSFYEGFGLGVLDADACGTPIVAAKNQCLVEVLGNNFKFVNPNDPDDIAKGIGNPNKNKHLPRKYSWKTVAIETEKIYSQI